MDKKTRNLISLGAAVASNCIPCFEHYYLMAECNGITRDEINAVVEIAEKVKNGAAIATKSFVCDIMNGEASPVKCSTACCG